MALAVPKGPLVTSGSLIGDGLLITSMNVLKRGFEETCGVYSDSELTTGLCPFWVAASAPGCGIALRG